MKTLGHFLRRQGIYSLIVFQVFYTLFPSWAWAVRHHGEIFEVEVSFPGERRPPILKATYQGQGGPSPAPQTWEWALGSDVLEDPSSAWQFQKTPSEETRVLWQGSPTTHLQFKVTPQGTLFFEESKGPLTLRIKTSGDVFLESKGSVSSHTIVVQAENFHHLGTLTASDLKIEVQQKVYQGERATTTIQKRASLTSVFLDLKGNFMADGAELRFCADQMHLDLPLENEPLFETSSLTLQAATLHQRGTWNLSQASFQTKNQATFQGTLTSQSPISFKSGGLLTTKAPLKSPAFSVEAETLDLQAPWEAMESILGKARSVDGLEWLSGKKVIFNGVEIKRPETLGLGRSAAWQFKGKTPLKGISFDALQTVFLDLREGGRWAQAINLPGTLTVCLSAKARQPFHLVAPWRANDGLTFKSTHQAFLLGEETTAGTLESAQGSVLVHAPSITIAKNSSATGHQDVVFEGEQLTLAGRVHSDHLLKIRAVQDVTLQEVVTAGDTLALITKRLQYGPYHLMAQNLVHLTLLDGGALTAPLSVPGFLKIEVSPKATQPLHILTDLKGEKGLEITDLPEGADKTTKVARKTLILGKAEGPAAQLESPQGSILLEGKELQFLHGTIFGQTGITAHLTQQLIHGQLVKKTPRTASWSSIINGNSDFTKNEPVLWAEFSPCHWRTNGSLSLTSPWLEFNGGSLWAKNLLYQALAPTGLSGVIHQGVSVDVLGDAAIESKFFFHGPCLSPLVNHRVNFQLQALGIQGRPSAQAVSQGQGLIPAGELSSLVVDGHLDFKVKWGRNVASTISAKILTGQEPIMAESLIANLRISGHPLYQGTAPIPLQSASQQITFSRPVPFLNAGTITSPLLQIAFSALHNGLPSCAVVPTRLPERPLKVELIEFFQGQGIAASQGTGAYALSPGRLVSSGLPPLPAQAVLHPHKGFVKTPLRFLFDPLTESRLMVRALMRSVGRSYLTEGETPFETYQLLRQNAATWQKAWGGETSASDKALVLSSSAPALAKALAQAEQPMLVYVPVLFEGEEVASPTLYFPPHWDSKAPLPGPGVISGRYVALMGTPDAPITNTGQIHAAEKGVLTGQSFEQTKEIDYGSRPALEIKSYQGDLVTGPTLYQPRWGGEVLGDTWAFNLKTIKNTLGWIDVNNLWLSSQAFKNTGRVMVQNLCLYDVAHTLQERLQRSWVQTVVHQRTESSWWGLGKDTTSWIERYLCREAYPAPLSGYLHAGTFVCQPDNVPAGLFGDVFPYHPDPVMETFFLRGGTLSAGPGGLSAWVRTHLETTPLIDFSVQAYAISKGGNWGRRYLESGAVHHRSILVPAMVSEGSLSWKSDQTMVLQALHARVTGVGKKLSFKAQGPLLVPDKKVWQPIVPFFEKEGRALYRVSGSRQEGKVTVFENPLGSIKLKSQTGPIRGIEPKFLSPKVRLEAGEVTFYPSLLRQNIQRHLMDSGDIDKGVLALVSLAATLASAGTLSPAIVGAGLKGTVTGAMISAGIGNLTSQAAVALLTHQGDVGAALKSIASSQGVRSLAVSVASAGVTQGVANELGINMTPETQTFMDRVQEGAVQAAVTTTVGATIGGQDLTDALSSGVRSGVATTVGGYLASKVGIAHKTGALDEVSHKLAHGVIGAGMAKITGGEAVAGALGAIVGEIIGQEYRAYQEAHNKFNPASPDFNKVVERGVALSRLSAAFVALLAGQDPTSAAETAGNAVRNNALSLVVPLVTGGVALYEGYEIYDVYVSEGPEAALQKAGFSIVTTVATGGVTKIGLKVAGKVLPGLYPSVEAAWAFVQRKSPTLSYVAQKCHKALHKGNDAYKALKYRLVNVQKYDWRKEFGIPKDWKQLPSDKPGGIKYQSPNNPKYNEVRIMKGEKGSDFPAQRRPYIKIKKNGHYYDKNGNIVNKSDPEAHIPLEEFKQKVEALWKKD